MVGGSKNVVFRMCLNLSDYQLKAICCVYRFMYINLMVTTNQKPIIATQKVKGKEPKHKAKENHQTTREETKRRKEQTRTTKTTRKQLTK